jgi:serine/threonine protein kinase
VFGAWYNDRLRNRSTGSRLDDYEVIELIGKGGMGEVYRAEDTRLPRDAAIKVSSEHFTERFARETSIIAGLNHPTAARGVEQQNPPHATVFLNFFDELRRRAPRGKSSLRGSTTATS